MRWVLVPTYLGLSLALLVLDMKGFHEAFPVLLTILSIKGSELVLLAPALITLVLVGGLTRKVRLSSDERFVSNQAIDSAEKLGGSVDGLREFQGQRVSSIHLLKVFMNTESIPNATFLW